MVLERSGYLVAKLGQALDRFCDVVFDLSKMVDEHQLEANHTTLHCYKCRKFQHINWEQFMEAQNIFH
jgi:hypothetical protein